MQDRVIIYLRGPGEISPNTRSILDSKEVILAKEEIRIGSTMVA